MRKPRIGAERVVEIKRLLAVGGMTDSAVGRAVGCNHSTVRAIRLGKAHTGRPKRQPEPRAVPCKHCGKLVQRRVMKEGANCGDVRCRYKNEKERLARGTQMRVLMHVLGFKDFRVFLENIRRGWSVAGCRECSCITPMQAEACGCICHGILV